ncbi:hypothetical protein NPIL_93101 [Nephila pilipes]|uniref:Uncharacterized protein n=1 Tax=Nephila pilipes TaxID=299642 RepID=A0A8X6UGR0_NEPPI|nr:hypothetical protein NPIL_93101 [Nephila pilipes]
MKQASYLPRHSSRQSQTFLKILSQISRAATVTRATRCCTRNCNPRLSNPPPVTVTRNPRPSGVCHTPMIQNVPRKSSQGMISQAIKEANTANHHTRSLFPIRPLTIQMGRLIGYECHICFG